MGWGYRSSYPAYVPVAKRQDRAKRKIAELKKKGLGPQPVVIAGPQIATTFWGRAWCEHLERYSDFESRLPRGRAYVKNGLVIDLRIEAGRVHALVSGSEVYEVQAIISAAQKTKWRALVKECTGKIGSVVELLTGKLSDGVMEVLCRERAGLFPSPKEIELECSCPDGAYLCKHLAAVLYGVGARLDHAPELLFTLRGVDQADLISEAGSATAKVGSKKGKNVLRTQDPSELAGLFGIELATDADAGEAGKVNPKPPPKKKLAVKGGPRRTPRSGGKRA